LLLALVVAGCFRSTATPSRSGPGRSRQRRPGRAPDAAGQL